MSNLEYEPEYSEMPAHLKPMLNTPMTDKPMPNAPVTTKRPDSGGACGSTDMPEMKIDSLVTKLLMGVDISEVYSQARVVREAVKAGIFGGLSMDLTTGYNLDILEDIQRAWKHIKETKPLVLV